MNSSSFPSKISKYSLNNSWYSRACSSDFPSAITCRNVRCTLAQTIRNYRIRTEKNCIVSLGKYRKLDDDVTWFPLQCLGYTVYFVAGAQAALCTHVFIGVGSLSVTTPLTTISENTRQHSEPRILPHACGSKLEIHRESCRSSNA